MAYEVVYEYGRGIVEYVEKRCLWVGRFIYGEGYLGMQGIWKEKGENVIIVNVYALGKMKKKRKLLSFEFSKGLCFQFRASRYITGFNRKSELKVI